MKIKLRLDKVDYKWYTYTKRERRGGDNKLQDNMFQEKSLRETRRYLNKQHYHQYQERGRHERQPSLKDRQSELLSREGQRERRREKGRQRGKPQRRRRSAQTPGVPTSLHPSKTPPRHRPARSQHEGIAPTPLPCRGDVRPWPRVAVLSRIVILCRRGAASIASPPRPSNFLLRPTTALSRVSRSRTFPARPVFRPRLFARDFRLEILAESLAFEKLCPFGSKISYPASFVNLSTHQLCGFIWCGWICWS